MITYTEKGEGLHAAIEAAGHWLTLRNGEWLSSDDAAVQAIIDGYTAAQTAAPVIAAIKEKARQIILGMAPEWKQANMTARAVELTEKMASGNALTIEEAAEMASLKAAWGVIRGLRAKSDAKEAEVAALVAVNDFAGIVAYDVNAGW